jgi:hypothetical protein
MAADVRVIPDPLIQHGRFRVLARTDGQFAVIDDALPPGRKTVAVLKTKDQAEASAKANHQLSGA